ncbi:hypothetical protein BRADI_3g44482v3 [Brachypodium distachyon]|uniref:Uncharacterized protein n=1 Tax=Brachypodium distachyon TaxID=15368 RepID=A0A2K2D368_BRADI|nr:hypothetical protein BRADI_3g44482v3 [Brachypodium distachyon]
MPPDAVLPPIPHPTREKMGTSGRDRRGGRRRLDNRRRRFAGFQFFTSPSPSPLSGPPPWNRRRGASSKVTGPMSLVGHCFDGARRGVSGAGRRAAERRTAGGVHFSRGGALRRSRWRRRLPSSDKWLPNPNSLSSRLFPVLSVLATQVCRWRRPESAGRGGGAPNQVARYGSAHNQAAGSVFNQ